ncbi:helix-turn-helix domain-containing protein [Sporomusa sp. KB1]|uniref:helix-turn-helix domain-containing protein n=1 Tax=Sporomusa sp. KB1 TaxID=943346 RepID=UPI00119E3C43
MLIRIKEQRKKLGLSQAALADKFGITQQAVGNWERGKALPDIKTLGRLADFFKAPTDYLLGRTNESSCLEKDSTLYKVTLEKFKQDVDVFSTKEMSIFDKSRISQETLENLIAIADQIKKEMRNK